MWSEFSNRILLSCRRLILDKKYLKMSISEDYNTWKKGDLIRRIQQLEEHIQGPKQINNSSPIPSPDIKKRKKMDFSKFTTRSIAIRFAYLGWNYNGLAYQDSEKIPTVENEILKALFKTKIIPSPEPSSCDFSRCGRTDKGVSALRQVISLKVRSSLTVDQQQDPSMDDKEVDYIRILNSQLPDDIVAYDVCLRPPEGFDARFSCKFRHYRYYFTGDGLNISKMQQAAQYFLGDHDFRNFCKVDASKQISNFSRTILLSQIIHIEGSNTFYFDLKGTAFLWHQVRSMIAILFLVGQEFESPDIISHLLDVQITPRRPVYEMAADFPLVLHDCVFPDMDWISKTGSDMYLKKQTAVLNHIHNLHIRTGVITSMYEMIRGTNESRDSKIYINTGAGIGRPLARYQPLDSRETIDPPEVVNAKWLEKKSKK